jgi:hypothetical protein
MTPMPPWPALPGQGWPEKPKPKFAYEKNCIVDRMECFVRDLRGNHF